MALVGVELETLVSESDALTTRPPPCAIHKDFYYKWAKLGYRLTSAGRNLPYQ